MSPRGGVDRALAILSQGREFESCLRQPCFVKVVYQDKNSWTHTKTLFVHALWGSLHLNVLENNTLWQHQQASPDRFMPYEGGQKFVKKLV